MADDDSERTDEGDEDGDEPNQYGGSTQDVDAVEQTERMTEGGEEDGDEEESETTGEGDGSE